MNDVTLRPITRQDREFLYRVYASTREEELAVLDWSEARKETFLRQQFDAQHRYYTQQFAGATFDVLELDGEPAGRLYVEQREDEIRIIDVALLPEYRNRGVGTSLLRGLLAEGEEAGLPVRIHVERYNRALRLYERLGFRQIADTGVYYLMEWSPERGLDPDARAG
jgi:ribosomal protein S18 acetylase RimI-like enzyme